MKLKETQQVVAVVEVEVALSFEQNSSICRKKYSKSLVTVKVYKLNYTCNHKQEHATVTCNDTEKVSKQDKSNFTEFVLSLVSELIFNNLIYLNGSSLKPFLFLLINISQHQ